MTKKWALDRLTIRTMGQQDGQWCCSRFQPIVSAEFDLVCEFYPTEKKINQQLRSHLQPGPKDHVVDIKEPRKTRSGLVLGKKNIGAMKHSTGRR